jgi:hypothetical protein
MVVATFWQDQWFILDNLTLALVPEALSEYVPLQVFDDSGMRDYVAKTPIFNTHPSEFGATRRGGLR